MEADVSPLVSDMQIEALEQNESLLSTIQAQERSYSGEGMSGVRQSMPRYYHA